MNTEPSPSPTIAVPAPDEHGVHVSRYDDRGPIVGLWREGWSVDVRFTVTAEDARAAKALAAAFQAAADDLAAKVAALGVTA